VGTDDGPDRVPRSTRPHGDRGRIEQVVEQHVAAHATTWFPELGPAPTTALTPLSIRPRCSLYVVRLEGGDASRAVVAKVRRPEPDEGGRIADRAPRPRLRTLTATVAELAELEYEGLRSIADLVGPEHPRFGAVRPLDHLPSESVVVMEHVSAPTLRAAFLAESRTAVVRRSRQTRIPPQAAWDNAGAWLRAFHALPSDRTRLARQQTRAQVLERFSAFGEFLARSGCPSATRIATTGARLASERLPERLPGVVGHGDFVARNMFLDAAGRITVFDPMPRWQVPPYEDICRFLVGMRLSGLQVHSQGIAYAQRALQRREDLFLGGYFGDDEVPLAAIGSYQLLILLDKWSALVDSAARRPGYGAAARRALMKPANAYIAREAHRLVARIRAGQPVE
jgi:hypothetical protein